MAKSSGDYYIIPYVGGPRLKQQNFESRILSMEACLTAILQEIEMNLPEREVKDSYSPSNEYEVYRDIKKILSTAKTSIMIVDPYVSREIFEFYVDGIERSVQIRVITGKGKLASKKTNGIQPRFLAKRESPDTYRDS